MLRLSNGLMLGLVAPKGLKDYFKVIVIQGLIAIKCLKANDFFRNLRISHMRREKNTIT